MASVTGIFLVDTDRTMCLGVNSASKKMSTSYSPGGKGDRCVRLTTYHPCRAERQEIRGLNLPGPPWAISKACCGRDLYLYLNLIQIGSGAHPASCTMGTGSFQGVKAAGAWRWPPTPILCRGHERVELYLYSPSGPVWPATEWNLNLPYLTLPYLTLNVTKLLHLHIYKMNWNDSFTKAVSNPHHISCE